MRTQLIMHEKINDIAGNTVEIKIWQLPLSSVDKPHGYRYSLAYVVNDRRVIGYDNGEGKGDHRHYGDREEPYRFLNIDRLINDFYEDIRRYKTDESKKGKDRHKEY